MSTNARHKVPVIGISTYHRNQAGCIEMPGQYADSVRRAGGIPVLIQPGETRLTELLELLDGMVFSGGGDLDPATYQGQNHEQIYNVSRERDDLEFALIRQLFVEPMPTLCICRGMQVLNVYLGGTLTEHIEQTSVEHRVPPRDPVSHSVTLDKGSILAGIIRSETFEVQSWHHQAIKTLGENMTAVAYAADGVIEAVEVKHAPWLIAVQWHPELSAAEDILQQRLFNELIIQTKIKSN